MAAIDKQTGLDPGYMGPARTQIAVTPSDTTDLTYVSRGFFIGVGGNLVVTPSDGGANVTYTVQAGQFLPICCTRVLATGTTASNIVSWS